MEKIRAYFLGDLTEAEQIRLEEEFFADEAKFAEMQAIENDLLDEYLREELDRETRRKFEQKYLNSPLRREKLAFAEVLREKAASPNLLRETKTSPFRANLFNFNFNLFLPRLAVGFGAIIALICGIWLALNYSTQKPEIAVATNAETGQTTDEKPLPSLKTPEILPAASPLANKNSVTNLNRNANVQKSENSTPVNTENLKPAPKPTTSPAVKPETVEKTIFVALSVPALRDESGKTATLNLPKDATEIAVRLNFADEKTRIYQVELQDVEGNIIKKSPNLRAGGNQKGKSVTFKVPAKAFETGDYVLRLTADDEEIANFTLRIVKK